MRCLRESDKRYRAGMEKAGNGEAEGREGVDEREAKRDERHTAAQQQQQRVWEGGRAKQLGVEHARASPAYQMRSHHLLSLAT